MAYADTGAGAPLLLVHGWAAHGGFFADLSQRLSQSNRVLVPTLRGHHGSGHGAAPLSIETLADDIAHFLETLDLRGVTALGWSMGAMALWQAYPRLAGRLSGLIVEEMAPRLTNDGGWSFGIAGNYRAEDIAVTLSEIRADWPAYVSRFAPRMFAPSARARTPELVEWAGAEMAKADPEAMAQFWGSMAAQDFRGRLSSITTPMLVMQGAESQVYPEGATAFVANAAPLGAHAIIPGAGHVPHLEAPEAFFQQVEAFVRNQRRPELRSGGAVP
ncbi:MAG: alpha/beta hydrolase [Hyphomonadaceae bacterium]|nr:alpha/beta hydrolase [Hyphomonadaceae bacterium]MBX3509824.1 alpha/beta hydrolase [Hyphomonadaceae bacterium]